MTEREYQEISKKIQKELDSIKKYYYEKSDNAEMFEHAKRIYGITSIYNHLIEHGIYYHYPAFPKSNLLSTFYDYLDKGGYDISENQIHDMLTAYQEENMDKVIKLATISSALHVQKKYVIDATPTIEEVYDVYNKKEA